MTRLVYDKTTAFGGILAKDVALLVQIKEDFNRLMAVANSLTGGGVTPANLEASKEFGLSVGQGATLYSDLQNIIAGLSAITTLADLDQGN
jgi:hypothetical protein